jgi:hypothetical protein
MHEDCALDCPQQTASMNVSPSPPSQTAKATKDKESCTALLKHARLARLAMCASRQSSVVVVVVWMWMWCVVLHTHTGQSVIRRLSEMTCPAHSCEGTWQGPTWRAKDQSGEHHKTNRLPSVACVAEQEGEASEGREMRDER